MDFALDGIIAILIIVGLFILIYCKIKDKSLKETFDDIKEMFVRE